MKTQSIKLSTILTAALGIIALTSCSEQELPPIDYVKWVEDASNGLKTTKQLEQFTFELQYRPTEYVALLEQGPDPEPSQFTQRVEELGTMQYFTLNIIPESGSLLKQNISSEQEYYQRLDYFNSFMREDLILVDGNDTLPCRLHHYEKTNGITPDHKFLLAFDDPTGSTGSKTLIYRDQVLGFGPIQLSLDKNDILDIPELTL